VPRAAVLQWDLRFYAEESTPSALRLNRVTVLDYVEREKPEHGAKRVKHFLVRLFDFY